MSFPVNGFRRPPMLFSNSRQCGPDLQQNLALALQYQQAGRLPEAESLFRHTLSLYPGHPELLHYFAILLMQMGKTDSALPLLEQARQSDPGNAAHWLLLTQCLLELGRPKEAKKVIAEAIRKGLRHPQAEELLERARSACEKPAGQTVPFKQRVALLEQAFNTRNFTKAESIAQSLAPIYPKSLRVWHVLGLALMAQGRHDEALPALQRALRLGPTTAELHFEIGQCYERVRRIEDAANSYRDALKLKRDFPEAANGLLVALSALGGYEEAIQVCDRILSRQPHHLAALVNKAQFLQKCGRVLEAIEVYRRALPQGKSLAEFHTNFGNALKDAGLLKESLAEFRVAIELDRNSLDAWNNLIFTSNYAEAVSHEVLLADARNFGEVVARKAKPYAAYFNSPEPERPLRVGLVSGDFGKHSVGYFLAGVLESLDKTKIDLFAYSTAYHQESELNRHLRACMTHWREATPDLMSDEVMARQIFEDKIDILVDLSGHTRHNRLPVFAWKPAPVQASWLGYLGTTGLRTIDYVIADPWSLPIGEEGQFTETPWRLPESYICFSPPQLAIDVGTLPALTNGYVTFGCFNNLSKVTDCVVACWSRLLLAVPESRLLLKSKALAESDVRKAVAERFAGHGVAPARLQMEGQQASQEEHLQTYRRVDIALDPFPYPGITTTVEGLWMGVPSVTLKGDRFLGHQGESIMNNARLPEWVAKNENDYVAKAASFASDLDSLSALRSNLRAQVLATPLFDAPGFARNLEAAFRGMWRAWCDRQNG